MLHPDKNIITNIDIPRIVIPIHSFKLTQAKNLSYL